MEVETPSENIAEVATEVPTNGADSSEPSVELPVSIEPVATISDGTASLEDILDSASAPVTEPMDVINSQQEDTNSLPEKADVVQNAVTNLPKEPNPNTFSLGVPGLKFSTNNVKTAKDGTKMVQIHQSQITPDQLLALQNNPNIKVVFRHVPSGKSYTKPPRHLLPPGYSAPIKKRKAQFTEEELESSDVYSFDEGEDFGHGPTKRTKLSEVRARYSYGSGKKKGRPRMIPDMTAFAASFLKTSKQQSLPAKVILTDLLARVNNPNAKKEVKLHTSQINAEVLANMELNPAFKIVLTTKQELPPLVIESVDPEEQAKLEKDAEEIEKQEKAKEEESEAVTEQTENIDEGVAEEQEQSEQMEEEHDSAEEEERRHEDEQERKEREAARQKKVAEEEAELKKSLTQTQKSRSGRIRKPSRYSLDIARLTKRKGVGASGGDSSADESEQETMSKPTKVSRKLNATDIVTSPSKGKTDQKAEAKKITSPKKSNKETGSEEEEKVEDTEKVESESEKKREEEGTGKVESEMVKAVSESEKKEDEEGTGKVESETNKPGKAESDSDKKKEEKVESESEKKEDEKGETKEVSDTAGNKQEKKEEEATESEKEITSTENIEAEKNGVQGAEEKAAEETEEKTSEQKESKGTPTKDVVAAEPDTSTDAVKTEATEKGPTEDESMDVEELFSLKMDEEDEKEVIDNKFRLRKLLEQCSTEEIRSVLLPDAFDAINIGDFLLYKSGEMHNSSGKISFPQLYKEFENLHKDATKEATRYNTLVRRANKVGGDKRMEKIVLMPVYNIHAAKSLEISNSSIDAHICGIQRTITTEMIAANSFFIKTKMEPPLVRLKLPEATATRHSKPKMTKRPLYSNPHQKNFQQQEPDSTTPDKPKQQSRVNYGQKIASMKFTTLPTSKQNQYSSESFQVRRPAYIEQLKTMGQISVGGQNHQIATTSRDNFLQGIPVDSTSLIKTDSQLSQMDTTATSALAQLQATVEQQQQAVVSTTGITSESGLTTINPTTGQVVATSDTALVTTAPGTTTQAEQYFLTEDGVPVTSASTEDGEVRKHLVPIGDGQYVELPEGYSLIQTDEGYIIGQPGSTFTQGEDGNVYVTNSDGTTAEITQQDVVGEGDTASVVDQVTEG